MKKHLSALVVLVLALGLINCTTHPKIQLRRSKLEYSLQNRSNEDVFNFENSFELARSLYFWNQGKITEGYWNGLTRKTYDLKNMQELEEIALQPSESVDNFIQAIKSRYPTFDNLHPVKKAQLIYDTLRKSIKPKISPFDKIRLSGKYLADPESNVQLAAIRTSNEQPYQNPEETFRYGGICINMAGLLHALYTRAGIKCTLLYQDHSQGNDHMLLAFEAFPNKFLPIDPTKSSLGFVRNIGESQRILKSSEVIDFRFLNSNLRKESLNLADYL
ncbi:hypothetical protein FJZ17_01150 [Candidatus Pacearchaeota archaeon]|nr:hypothetical protein [Candidatus Pacearchaeota archaeon]